MADDLAEKTREAVIGAQRRLIRWLATFVVFAFAGLVAFGALLVVVQREVHERCVTVQRGFDGREQLAEQVYAPFNPDSPSGEATVEFLHQVGYTDDAVSVIVAQINRVHATELAKYRKSQGPRTTC